MRLIDFIICDDVRHEVGSKMSVMGVFGDEMEVLSAAPDKPFALRLGVFVRIKLDPGEVAPDSAHFEIKHNGASVLSESSPIDTKGARKGINLAVNIPQVTLSGFGILSFEIVLLHQGTPMGEAYGTEVALIPPKV